MAVSFDPRASSTPRAGVQTNDIVRPTPIGLANAPSTLELSTSSSDGCCGWIASFFEWIRSLFSVSTTTFPPTHEGMIAKGKTMIDEVLKNPPPFNPAITGLVCMMRFNDACELHYCRASREGDTFKEDCYRQWESLLNREDLSHVTSGTVAIKMMYFEKINPNFYNFSHRDLSTKFPGSDRDAEGSGRARGVTWDRVADEVEEINDRESRYALFGFFRAGL